MIEMIGKLLTETQKAQIVEIIKDRSTRFRSFERQYETLFYEPYTQMRHKHSATSAVISGFAPGKFQIDGITSTDLNYGLNDKLVQPELRCEKGIFHIYSDGSDLKGKKILERCKELNDDITTPPLFFLIIVSIDKKGNLNKIDIWLPNKDAEIVDKATIYEKQKLIAISA